MGGLGSNGTFLVLGACGALALGILMVAAPLPRRGWIAVSLLLAIASSTFIERGGATGLSEVARLAAVVVAFRLTWRSTPPLDGDPAHRGGSRTQKFVPVLVLAITGFLGVATLLHGQVSAFVPYVLGAVLLVLYARILTRHATGRDLCQGALLALGSTVVSALVVAVFLPGIGVLQGRVRGLTSNPNLLGFYCAAFLAILLLRPAGRRFTSMAGLGLGVGGIILVLTGSRASLLAVVIVVLVVLGRQPDTRLKVLALAGGAGVATVLVAFPSLIANNDALILRQGNSRAESLDYALQSLQQHPWSGIGLDNELVQVASTPLRAITQAGLFGGLAVAVIYLAILVFSIRAGRGTVGFGIAMIVHSLFEGWLLSPVGPLALTFVVVWTAIAAPETTSMRESPVPSRLRHQPS
jgi:hypothetical protein